MSVPILDTIWLKITFVSPQAPRLKTAPRASGESSPLHAPTPCFNNCLSVVSKIQTEGLILFSKLNLHLCGENMTQTHATNFSNNSKNIYNKEQSTPPGFGVFFNFFYRRHADSTTTRKDQVPEAFRGSHFYSFKFLKCSILEKHRLFSLYLSASVGQTHLY